MTPSMILTNARILTMDPDRPRAEAIALAGGRIQALGSRAEVEALAGPATEVVDCRGATLIDRKSTRLNSSHIQKSRMPSSA